MNIKLIKEQIICGNQKIQLTTFLSLSLSLSIFIYIYIHDNIVIYNKINYFLINNKYLFNNEIFDSVKPMKMIQYVNVVKKIYF